MGMIKNDADKERAVEFAAMLECVQDMDVKKLEILRAALALCKDENEIFAFQNAINSAEASVRFLESNKNIFERIAA